MSVKIHQDLVVVPWDFSELSLRGLEKAMEMVQDVSQLRVVYVSDYPSAMASPVAYWENITEDTIRKNILKSYAHHVADYPQFKSLEIEVLFGDPGTEICRYAELLKAGLIIVPSHGRSGISRILLGSVAERIVRYAPCPVFILRGLPVENEKAAEQASAKIVGAPA